jgi:ABC-type Mn2+/Zn2+ transport system ATPase subunit
VSAPSDAVLTLEHLAVGHDRQVVLQDLNLALARGSFTALLGANGSGKSTLIKTLLGILPPVEGRMTYTPVEGRAVILGYVPQRDSLDPIYLLSSFEVVLMGVCGRVKPGRRPGLSERSWVRECLRLAGAEALGRRQFSELSGGQKQRVLLARALAARPDFLLLEEPTSGIDVTAKQSIMALLRTIHREQSLTILMASHDLPVVRDYAGRIIWLHQGRVLEGTVEELLSREKLAAVLDLEMN